MRSATSVADLALMVSGGNVSSNSIFLMALTKSLITSWDTLKSPPDLNGRKLSPWGPPLRATGIMEPGAILTVAGFNTPSSAAVYTPATEIDAFFKSNSLTLFKVLMSGRALTRGPRP